MTSIVLSARAPWTILGATALALASLALMLSVTQDAAAQTYPTKPVRLMVGAPAGGGTTEEQIVGVPESHRGSFRDSGDCANERDEPWQKQRPS